LRIGLLTFLLLAPSAMALEPPKRPDYPFPNATPVPERDRAYLFELSFRGRRVSLPRAIVDRWYFDDSDPNWAFIEPRPHIAGTAFGLELAVRDEHANGIFYAEFVHASLGPGYWDDVEDPAEHLDGVYLEPSDALGLVGAGANYAYEVHILDDEKTQDKLGVSWMIGGGLGVGVLVGRIDKWNSDKFGNPAYKRYLDGVEPDEAARVPRVFPLVDVNTGVRLTIGRRGVIRLEGGLHTLLYYGATAGVTF
jgi:hypothetical protein